MRLPTKGGNQEVLCLKLDFVPLWLAKISITPTREQETPELVFNLPPPLRPASSPGPPAAFCIFPLCHSVDYLLYFLTPRHKKGIIWPCNVIVGSCGICTSPSTLFAAAWAVFYYSKSQAFGILLIWDFSADLRPTTSSFLNMPILFQTIRG